MALKNFLFHKIKTDKYKRVLNNLDQVNFHMSFRFNKTKPEDFGLINTVHDNIFIDPKDNSKWEKRYLIDFGWGLEVAFCKLPYPSFNELLNLSFYANPKEKLTYFYCAIGILLNDYQYELLDFTEKILIDKKNSLQDHKEFYHMVRSQMDYYDNSLKIKWQALFDQTNELI